MDTIDTFTLYLEVLMSEALSVCNEGGDLQTNVSYRCFANTKPLESITVTLSVVIFHSNLCLFTSYKSGLSLGVGQGIH